jgi:hypothetical protein
MKGCINRGRKLKKKIKEGANSQKLKAIALTIVIRCKKIWKKSAQVE